mgnify:CR=1 FL=1
MNKILKSQLSGPSVWNANTFENDDNWIYNFSDEEPVSYTHLTLPTTPYV